MILRANHASGILSVVTTDDKIRLSLRPNQRRNIRDVYRFDDNINAAIVGGQLVVVAMTGGLSSVVTQEEVVALVDEHADLTDNPHEVTKTQVGLGNVANVNQQVASNITSGTLDGDRLPAMSTTKQGAVPLTGTPSGLFLKDDGTWASAGGGSAFDAIVTDSSELQTALTNSSVKSIFIKTGTYTFGADVTQATAQHVVAEGGVNVVFNVSGAHFIAATGGSVFMNIDFSGASNVGGGADGLVNAAFDSIFVNCVVRESAGRGFNSYNLGIEYFGALYACRAYDCVNSGFFYCHNLSDCIAETCGVSGNKAGFESCEGLVSCSAKDCYDGFKYCDQGSNCYAQDNTNSNFYSCEMLTGCRALGGGSSTYGFYACQMISGCFAEDHTDTDYRSCESMGSCFSYFSSAANAFFGCYHLSGCRAWTCSGNGFANSSQISASRANGCTGYGFTNCNFVSACESVTSTAGNWNAGTYRDTESTN